MKPLPYNDRYVILMMDHDKETYLHHLVLAPKGLEHDEAIAAIDMSYHIVSRDEEWNYDDLFEELQRRGFDQIPYMTWLENEA